MKIQRILHPFRGKNSSKGGAGGTADLTGASHSHRAAVDEFHSTAAAYNNNNAEEDRTRAASPMEESVQYDYHYAADFYGDDDNNIHSNSNDQNQHQIIQHNQKVFGEVESYFSSTTAPTTASPDHNDGSAASSARVRPPRQPPNNNNNNSPRKAKTTTTTVRVPPPPLQQQQQPQPYSDRSAQTRHLVKQFIADIWNRGELDLIPAVCSPSLRFNGNTGFDRVGHDGLARMVAHMRDCLAEYHCEIHSMVVEDNKCFCRLRMTGKHVGPLLGYPPTQQAVAWMGAAEYTIQNDKILKVWELGDVKSLEEQLQGHPTGQRSTSIAKNVD